MVIDNYLIDRKNYSLLPRDIKCKFLSTNIRFICLSNTFIKEIEKILKKYQIAINHILELGYVKEFADKISASKLTNYNTLSTDDHGTQLYCYPEDGRRSIAQRHERRTCRSYEHHSLVNGRCQSGRIGDTRGSRKTHWYGLSRSNTYRIGGRFDGEDDEIDFLRRDLPENEGSLRRFSQGHLGVYGRRGRFFRLYPLPRIVHF